MASVCRNAMGRRTVSALKENFEASGHGSEGVQ